MRNTVIVLTLSILLLAVSSSGADCAKKGTAVFERTVELIKEPAAKGTAASCQMHKMIVGDTILGYSSGFVTGDRTVCYYDPSECGDPTYPFEISSFSFTLFDPYDNWDPRYYKWPVQLDVVLYEPYSMADTCLGPGVELCRVPVLCDSATFNYPNCGTVTFPTPCCVESPFFIGIEYTDTYTGLLPSIFFDVSSEPDTCHLYQYVCDYYWIGWYAYWITPPGYPFYWVNGETMSTSCCDDTDGDNVCDIYDICPGYDDNIDTDSDGVPDGCDICAGFDDNLDDDADGVPDGCDLCPGFDDTIDSDLDGIPNGCDNCPVDANAGQEDDDGDLVGNICDNCPLDYNPWQLDTDENGVGNECDDDDDGDGVLDVDDNCPIISNPFQEDADIDGIGDACECVGMVGNLDCDPLDEVNGIDLSYMIDHLFISLAPLCSEVEGNVDLTGGIDGADLSTLIDHLFISLDPLPDCPL